VEEETFIDFVRLAFEGWIGHTVLILLGLMSAGVVSIAIDRIRRYKLARKNSADFRQLVGKALGDHTLDHLISIAQGDTSPGAVVLASGLVAFHKSRALSFGAYEAAAHAMELSARAAHFKMSRGMNHLAAIVVTAFLVGAFSTCYDILTGFKGCGSSRESCIAAFEYELSRALVPTEWGFLVAIPAMLAHRYLESEINSFDLEMETASLDVLNYLALRHGQEKSMTPPILSETDK